MTPANVNRVEITLSDDKLAALDAARGFEPRASFIKRVLEQALSDSPTGGETRTVPYATPHTVRSGKPYTPPRPKGQR